MSNDCINRMGFWIDHAKELYELWVKELDKLPHQINLIDELHANENAHSRILQKLLLYKTNGEFEILRSFVERFFKDHKKYILLKIKKPNITAEKGRIDCLIEEYPSYAIIIENKVKGAPDQEKQLERYYEQVIQHKIDKENIYIVYLTKDGHEPGDNSLTPRVKEKLNCGDESQSRFIPLSYHDHILHWLEKKILPKINDREEALLLSALIQYIDHLKGMFGKREREQPVYDIMKTELKHILNLNDNNPAEAWSKLKESAEAVETLRQQIYAAKNEYSLEVVKRFESLAERYFGNRIKSQILDSHWLQIQILHDQSDIHFEFIDLSVEALCKGIVTLALHAEGTEKSKAVELMLNDAFKTAAKKNGFSWCYEFDENQDKHIETVIDKVIYLDKGFEKSDVLKDINDQINDLIKYIQDNRLREHNKELNAIRGYLQKTTDVVIDEPWLGFDLVMSFNDGEIGIESYYAINKDNELEYRIMITSWRLNDWEDSFKADLRREFEVNDFENHSNRPWLHLQSLKNPDKQKIQDELERVYNILKKIVPNSNLENNSNTQCDAS